MCLNIYFLSSPIISSFSLLFLYSWSRKQFFETQIPTFNPHSWPFIQHYLRPTWFTQYPVSVNLTNLIFNQHGFVSQHNNFLLNCFLKWNHAQNLASLFIIFGSRMLWQIYRSNIFSYFYTRISHSDDVSSIKLFFQINLQLWPYF
jgi:hypothetical protein